MKRPEILAPAGSWETLRAAVAAGADAVYFGGRQFNARRNADNFDDTDLAQAVSYCRARGVKAYITFNTVVFDRETQEALAFIETVCAAGADAVITQDLGLAALIREAAPGLRLHASTQMSVHNIEGVRLLARLGFSRVVLSRELAKGELAQILRDSPLEIELFVHGALCMSLSGQCYLSGMLGGRSGNRGLCAQPCRLPFAAPGGTGHDLSLRDLSLVEEIETLSQMGVASLKIEGRMKRPEYVAAATDICRRAALGQPVRKEELEGLRAVFSRGGFTKGYFEEKRGRAMFGTRGRDDVLASQEVLAGYHALYSGERPRVPVEFTFEAAAGRPARLTARDADRNKAEWEGPVPEAAKTKPLEAAALKERLCKTGGTPFYVRGAQIQADKGLALSASAVNGMRRGVLDRLLALRAAPRPVAFKKPLSIGSPAGAVNPAGGPARPELRLRLRRFGQLTETAANEAAEIFLPPDEILGHREQARAYLANGGRLGAELPRACFGAQMPLWSQKLAQCGALGIKSALCGNLGSVYAAQELGLAVHGDFGLNAVSARSLAVLVSLGLSTATLSFEAALSDLGFAKEFFGRAGLIAYGRLPLMLTRNCPLQNGGKDACAHCKAETGALCDRKGILFPVVCFGGASELLGDRPLWMCDRKNELFRTGISFASLYFTLESSDEVDGVLKAWREGLPCPAPFTRGLYERGAL